MKIEIICTLTSNVHVFYKTRKLRFSRSVSKDDGEKVARCLVAFPRAVIVFCNLIHCFATFSLTFPPSLLKPGFHIIAPVATVANKIIQRQEQLERWERFLGFHIIATIATKMANDRGKRINILKSF